MATEHTEAAAVAAVEEAIKLAPPEEVRVTDEGMWVCPECGREIQTARALASHRRVHGYKGVTSQKKGYKTSKTRDAEASLGVRFPSRGRASDIAQELERLYELENDYYTAVDVIQRMSTQLRTLSLDLFQSSEVQRLVNQVIPRPSRGRGRPRKRSVS